tara:strand:+ start:236 stop:442 length:207 start_codon:yes stop_codon:yes gene_type:complete
MEVVLLQCHSMQGLVARMEAILGYSVKQANLPKHQGSAAEVWATVMSPILLDLRLVFLRISTVPLVKN